MTKAILLAMKPEHALNILEGRKTLELRKSVPKDFKGWVYVYVTKAKPFLMHAFDNTYYLHDMTEKYRMKNDLNGTIPFRFWFDEYDEILNHGHKFTIKDKDEGYTNLMAKKSCLDFTDLVNYFKEKNGYAWHIKKLEIFSQPKTLSDFYGEQQIERDWREFYKASDGFTPLSKEQYFKHYNKADYAKSLLKAPQSWQYVWVKE